MKLMGIMAISAHHWRHQNNKNILQHKNAAAPNTLPPPLQWRDEKNWSVNEGRECRRVDLYETKNEQIKWMLTRDHTIRFFFSRCIHGCCVKLHAISFRVPNCLDMEKERCGHNVSDGQTLTDIRGGKQGYFHHAVGIIMLLFTGSPKSCHLATERKKVRRVVFFSAAILSLCES